MRRLNVPIFAIAAFFLAGSLGLVAPMAAKAQEAAVEAPPREVAVVPAARDDQIQRRIKDILNATGWFTDVVVDVDDGVVFLDGGAISNERRAWAERLAGNTGDVAAVVNRIVVRHGDWWSAGPALVAVERLTSGAVAAAPLLLFAVIVLPLAWLAAGYVAGGVRWLMARRVESVFLRDVIAKAAAIPVFLLGVYLVLQASGLTQLAVSILGGAGVFGIVVGFAFRDIAENFLASILLSMRRPFRVGDFLDVGGKMGVVQSMNTRSTILVSLEGNHIQIPNATVFKSTIVNYSAAPKRRETLDVGIGYDAPISDVQGILLDVLKRHEAVLGEPEPVVLVESLGVSTVNLKAYFWFDGHAVSSLKLTSSLLRLMKTTLLDAGVSMPDAAREIVFPEGVPLVGVEPSAPAPPTAPPRRERDDDAILAEGGLENELAELDEQVVASDIPEGKTNLLADNKSVE